MKIISTEGKGLSPEELEKLAKEMKGKPVYVSGRQVGRIIDAKVVDDHVEAESEVLPEGAASAS